MNFTVESILSAVLASVATTSILGLVILEILKRWISSKFEIELEKVKGENAEKLAKLNSKLDLDREVAKHLSKLKTEVYPKICQEAYRARAELLNAMKACALSANNDESIDNLIAVSEKQSNNIHEYYITNAFFLPDALRLALHGYKNLIISIGTVAAVNKGSTDGNQPQHDLRPFGESLSVSLEYLVSQLKENGGIMIGPPTSAP